VGQPSQRDQPLPPPVGRGDLPRDSRWIRLHTTPAGQSQRPDHRAGARCDTTSADSQSRPPRTTISIGAGCHLYASVDRRVVHPEHAHRRQPERQFAIAPCWLRRPIGAIGAMAPRGPPPARFRLRVGCEWRPNAAGKKRTTRKHSQVLESEVMPETSTPLRDLSICVAPRLSIQGSIRHVTGAGGQ